MSDTVDLRAPFPWFGGKSKVADIVWDRFGDVPNYVEPFFGSGAVLLGRPHEAHTETVNDMDCVAPDTRILMSDLSWIAAGDVKEGDALFGFDERNGEAREGLRAPKRYRRLAKGTVQAVRRAIKPCYRLTFDDGTSLVASADHMWLGGSHASGGRGWRWVRTANMVCNRATQRTWVLKVTDVIQREESYQAGWVGGILDGEGNIKVGTGLKVCLSQNEGPVLDSAEALIKSRGFDIRRRKGQRRAKRLEINGGLTATLSLLMRFRPQRLIANLQSRLTHVSLYGREHRAVGLVSKEYLGEREVVAIQTDCHTFIAEGLASHNCFVANFWRALQSDPGAVAAHADNPVNEADQHARHLWLVNNMEFQERMKTDPLYFDSMVAGWWVWGQSIWIGSGWCAAASQRPHLGNAGKGVKRQLPHLGDAGAGVHRQLPHLGDAGEEAFIASDLTSGTRVRAGLQKYLTGLADRLRKVRVCCGDWSRVCGPSVTFKHGITAVFLDPPYGEEAGRNMTLYASDSGTVATDVRKWAIENGDNRDLRIALCGYEGEHAMPESWECVAWKARGGYGSQGEGSGRENAGRERIWFSPHCVGNTPSRKMEKSTYFGGLF